MMLSLQASALDGNRPQQQVNILCVCRPFLPNLTLPPLPSPRHALARRALAHTHNTQHTTAIVDAETLRLTALDGTGAVITGSGRAAPWHKHNTIFVINPSKVRGLVDIGWKGVGRLCG